MYTVKKLQDLWRLRRYVAGVCLLALLAGMFVSYHPSFPPKSRSYDVGIATSQVLVDTPRSQVVGASSAVTPAGAQALGTLATQANLLAGLMVEGTIKADIAQRAGLKPNQLIGSSAAVTVPSAAGSAASGPSSASVPSGPNVFALTTQILTDSAGDATLPIIEIEAQAPDRDKAARLASAAVAGLQAFVSSQAADEKIPSADRLSIVSLGVSQATTETHGPSPMMGFIVALVVLLLGCVSILWILGVIRGWRSASERERLGLGEPSLDGGEWEPDEFAPRADTARRPALSADRLLHRHAGNGLSRLVINGRSRPHFPANGASGKSNHGDPAAAGDHPSFPTGDASGQDPASSSREWPSRQV